MGLVAEDKYLEAEISGHQIPLQKTCPTLLDSGKVPIAAANGICWVPETLYAMDFAFAADVTTFA